MDNEWLAAHKDMVSHVNSITVLRFAGCQPRLTPNHSHQCKQGVPEEVLNDGKPKYTCCRIHVPSGLA
jgi:hypothetical protein